MVAASLLAAGFEGTLENELLSLDFVVLCCCVVRSGAREKEKERSQQTEKTFVGKILELTKRIESDM